MSRVDTIRDSDGKLPAYAWPGGYPMFYVTTDGGTLCPACANGENGSEAFTDPALIAEDPNAAKQRFLEGYDANWEDDNMTCDHCGEAIESAYGEP